MAIVTAAHLLAGALGLLLAGEPLVVDPAALVGCRAPDEPNCSRCCLAQPPEAAEARCHYRVGEEDWSLYAVEPWYNGMSFEPGACPDDCSPCARCSERDEQALRSLAPRPECDCEALTVGVDPCYVRESCECHCQTLESLTAMCPPADPLD